MKPLLQLESISKSFGKVKALANISLRVEAGEILALLGENGAGKSTLMKVLCGIYQPDSGFIKIDGEEVKFNHSSDARKAGINIIFQEFSLVPYLNAIENIFLGRELTNRFGLLDRHSMEAKAREVFARLGVALDLHVPVAHLSVAEQQFIEIAKALSADTRILILDEPTATLTPNEAQHLFRVMRGLQSQGVGMIFITHHMEEILEVCGRVTVIRDGEYIGDSSISTTSVDSLVEMMVGRRLASNFPQKRKASLDGQEILIDVRALQLKKNGPTNSFSLKKGEILGFAGLVGSGRTELVRGLLGAAPVYKSEIVLEGRQVALSSPAIALEMGLGLLPESRKTEGLMVSFSIRENITINNLSKHCRNTFLIDHHDENRSVDELIRRVGVKAPCRNSVVSNLSGGNQQKVVIARWLNHNCKVLIFDEPTRGIDVGAKAEIYELMRSLTDAGLSIIMISSELPEVVGLSDRVAVFRQGKIVQILSAGDVNSNEIMLHATGGV